MDKDSKIFVAGHRGMVGSALLRRLEAGGYTNVVTRNRLQLELLDQRSASEFIEFQRPEVVFFALGRNAATHAAGNAPATRLHEHLCLQTNVIQAAHEAGVKQLLFVADHCIYPEDYAGPVPESAFAAGAASPRERGFAIAKQAGVALCEALRAEHGRDYLSVVPSALYGPGARFDPDNGHLLPALMQRAHAAREAGETSFEVWGDGSPLRDFLHVDDFADACVRLLEGESGWSLVNVGSGRSLGVAAAAEALLRAMDWQVPLRFAPDKAAGARDRVLDLGRIASLGWQAGTALEEGLAASYAAFVEAGAGKKKKKRPAA